MVAQLTGLFLEGSLSQQVVIFHQISVITWLYGEGFFKHHRSNPKFKTCKKQGPVTSNVLSLPFFLNVFVVVHFMIFSNTFCGGFTWPLSYHKLSIE